MPLKSIVQLKRPQTQSSSHKPKQPLTAFASTGSDEDKTERSPLEILSKRGSRLKRKSDPSGESASCANPQLATFNSICSRSIQSAEEADPNVYDYDGAWEDMKTFDRAQKKNDELDAMERRPKYMKNLLAAAQIRKRDQLRAKEKLLLKERQAEGDEFAHNESFVTEAYKKQQENLVMMENEERVRENNMRKKSQGMSSFHRNMLEKMERKHSQVVAATKTKDYGNESFNENDSADELAAIQQTRVLNNKGFAIDVNEEGQVVDKTQLLTGGLNLVPSKANIRITSNSRHRHNFGKGPLEKIKLQENSRFRQSKLAQEQPLERTFEILNTPSADEASHPKSKKSKTEVQNAKDRYLARKAAAAAHKIF